MGPRLRHVITALFLIGFVVTAPMVILDTKGYRYNWHKGRLEKTGIIKLDSIPAGANIYLNGVLQPKTTPASLFRLLPEDYEVSFKKAGYLTWAKTLRVNSGETTFVENVILLKDAVPELIETGDIAAGSFSADGQRVAALRRGRDWLELVIYDLVSRSASLLARFELNRFSGHEMAWSPAGDFLLFSAGLADGGRELYLYPTAAGDKESKALHPMLPQDGRLTARWSTDGARISVVTDRGVFVIDPNGWTASPLLIQPDVSDAIVVGSDAFVARDAEDGSRLERTSVSQPGVPKKMSDLPAGHYVFSDANENYLLLTDEKQNRSLLWDERAGSVAETFDAGHAVWEKPSGNGRLLLWNDFEITIYDPASKQRQLVTRLGEPLAGCIWHPTGADIIFAAPSGLFSIELDDRDTRIVFSLAPFKDIGAFFIDPAGKALWFIGAVGNQRGIYERSL
jgi:hypothetical protein